MKYAVNKGVDELRDEFNEIPKIAEGHSIADKNRLREVIDALLVLRLRL
jgi:hypothetical protein